ncbi:MAG TPA: hypothetical protein VIL48_12940 [Acidimicrobiales bacterium]
MSTHTTAPASAALLARARSLRARAAQAHPLLAGAYRRRAAELQLEAWARTVRSSGPVDIDDVSSWAA